MKLPKSNSPKFLFLFLLFLGLSACYEPVEGCLDLKSSNYDITADNGCSDCCTYPNLTLRINPVWNGEDLRTDSIYINPRGDSIKLNVAEFLISNIILVHENGRHLTPMDSISVDCDEGSIFNSFSTVSLTSLNAVSYGLALTEGFQTIQFELGVDDCLLQSDTTQLLKVLSSAQDYLDQRLGEMEYQSAFLQISSGAELADTTAIRFINEELSIKLSFSGTFEIVQGTSLFVELNLDFAELLSDFSATESDQLQKTVITQNLPTAFTLLD